MTARTAPAERPRGVRCCSDEARPSVSAERAGRLSRVFEALAHPIRLQLLDVLSRSGGRVCVCDLVAALPVKQPTISHHLKLLREAGMVDCERQGNWAYYFVNHDAVVSLRNETGRFLNDLSPQQG